jgi:hypothetical protein
MVLPNIGYSSSRFTARFGRCDVSRKESRGIAIDLIHQSARQGPRRGNSLLPVLDEFSGNAYKPRENCLANRKSSARATNLRGSVSLRRRNFNCPNRKLLV